MRHDAAFMPAFGQADLSNCEREQIHLAGSIQPHGALLLADEPGHVVRMASDNAAAFLGLPGDVLGLDLQALGGDLAARIQPCLRDRLDELPVAVRCYAGTSPAPHDVTLHRPAGGGLVLELERAEGPLEVPPTVGTALRAVLDAFSLQGLCDEVARIFRDLTGYDRVMVYRFDEDGHGEVFAEQRNPELEPYLGNRYPATDIPQIARRLYERNRVRVLVDVQAAQSRLVPARSPLSGAALDMSLCGLRSMSPLHIQYLRNMGVSATLVVSLMVSGQLWGLVACHHYAPRRVSFAERAASELLAEAIGTRIAALEGFARTQAELAVRRLEARMIESITRAGDWQAALFDGGHTLLAPFAASGAALLFEGGIQTAGEVPGTQALRDLGAWLDARHGQGVTATASLGRDEPGFAPLVPMACGLLATPVSSTPGDYLLWFRPERIRTVTWGGDPYKSVVIGSNPAELSPRRSFAQWHQVVEGTSEPWVPAELAAARLIGEIVQDVVLQFRSVRLLIAQDQLDHVRRQVGKSEQPVVIVDAAGAVMVANRSAEALFGPDPIPATAEALAALFTERRQVRDRLHELLRRRTNWRGEVTLRGRGGPARPLLLRADPVLTAPGRALGFVLLFTDLTERKAAERARRRFQEAIVNNRPFSRRLDSRADLAYRTLLSSLVENAQLAALEITDGADVARMPALLASIQASVARSARVLAQMILHATRVTQPLRRPAPDAQAGRQAGRTRAGTGP